MNSLSHTESVNVDFRSNLYRDSVILVILSKIRESGELIIAHTFAAGNQKQGYSFDLTMHNVQKRSKGTIYFSQLSTILIIS
jgi:hypothetical protein